MILADVFEFLMQMRAHAPLVKVVRLFFGAKLLAELEAAARYHHVDKDKEPVVGSLVTLNGIPVEPLVDPRYADDSAYAELSNGDTIPLGVTRGI